MKHSCYYFYFALWYWCWYWYEGVETLRSGLLISFRTIKKFLYRDDPCFIIC